MGLRCWFEIMGNCCSCKAGLHLSGVPFADCSLSSIYQQLATLKPRRTKTLGNSWTTPEGLCLILPRTPWAESGGNTSDFLCYCSQHPTFLLQLHRPRFQLVSSSDLLLLSLFMCNPFFPLFLLLLFFPGSNQEKLWEQRLPISAGEWRSAVWVSTLPFPGSAFTSLIQKESLSSKLADPSAAGVSQAEPLLLCCLFVGHIKWAHVSSGAIWCFHAQICKNLF